VKERVGVSDERKKFLQGMVMDHNSEPGHENIEQWQAGGQAGVCKVNIRGKHSERGRSEGRSGGRQRGGHC
jgi:hypothetical protein